MKISVITCTYNSAKYLPKTLESVRTQSWQDVEHIFVDGGSTDGTLQMIERANPEAIVLHDVRGGISAAMNAGLEMASGDVVAHLHSDDYYASDDVLSVVAGAFEEPAVNWIYGRCLSDRGGQVTASAHQTLPFSIQKLLRRNFIPHPATFLRRELFGRIGAFDTKLRYAMDYDLWLRAAKFQAPRFLDKDLAVFRRHAGSTSTANQQECLREDFEVRMRHVDAGVAAAIEHRCRYYWRATKLMAF